MNPFMRPVPPHQAPVAPALAAWTPTSAWSSNLYTPEELRAAALTARSGQMTRPPSDNWAKLASGLALAGTGLGVYHGYMRTGSLGWALAWGLLGGMFPIITIPVAIAQGFARPEFPKARQLAAARASRGPRFAR